MNIIKKILLGAAMIATPFSYAVPSVLAQSDLDSNLDRVGSKSGLGDEPLTETIGSLINVFLGLLGIIFLLLTIYAGFLWMTAGGDEKKVGTAKQILISAVVGLVILLSAYAISNFVIDQLTTATGI